MLSRGQAWRWLGALAMALVVGVAHAASPSSGKLLVWIPSGDFAASSLVRMARERHAGDPRLAHALQLATRNVDGRAKDVRDIVRARAAVVALLASPLPASRSVH